MVDKAERRIGPSSSAAMISQVKGRESPGEASLQVIKETMSGNKRTSRKRAASGSPSLTRDRRGWGDSSKGKMFTV